MDLTLVTPPLDTAFDPWLAAAKAYLRRDEADDDAVLLEMLRAAVGFFDGPHGRLARALVPQTWRLTLDDFEPAISIPLPPLRSVDAVTYLDTAGAQIALQADAYTISGTDPGIIRPVAHWPRTRASGGIVTVTFTAGFASLDDVPSAIKVAVFEYLTALYDSRGTLQGVPPAVSDLADGYRARAFG